MSINPTRRRFLKATTATCAAGFLGAATPSTPTAPSTRGYASGFQSVNEQPGIAFCGKPGFDFHTYHGKQALKYGPCIGVCDVDAVQAGRAFQVAVDEHRARNRKLVIGAHEDYRRLLDNKDVDVVVIGTVDHLAFEDRHRRAAGRKACLLRKTGHADDSRRPADPGGRLNKSNRVLQVGTQQRTEFGKKFATAAAMVRDNRVGENRSAGCFVSEARERVIRCRSWDPPKNISIGDLWLGQCPATPYRANDEIADVTGWGAGFPFSRTHRYYRWFYEYSGGKLTDWGAHHVDIAMWALNKLHADIGPVTIDPLEVKHPVEFDDKGMPMSDDRFNCATQFKVKCTFADGIEMLVRDQAQDELGFENGIMFTGKDRRPLPRQSRKDRGTTCGRVKEEPAS